jgi:bifunctional DNase/RNase
MKRKELKILGLSYSQTQIGSYVCVLSEKKGGRKIPLIVKPAEAQKIAIELEGIKSSRPSSHDLVKSLCDSFYLDIQEVYIYALLEGVFYTKVIASNGLDEVEIETTVGDGLALSVIFKCPIFTTSEILNTVGVIINDDGTPKKDEELEITDDDESDEDDEFDIYIEDDKKERLVSVEDLEKLMHNAIDNEEYEIAAELRDRISKLKESK